MKIPTFCILRRGIYIAHAIPPRRWFWRLLKIFTKSGFQAATSQEQSLWCPPNNKPVTVFSQKGWLVEMAWLSQKRGFEVKIWPKPTFPASKSDQRNSTNQWNHKAGHGFSRPQFVFGLALGTLGAYCYPSLAQPFIFCISAGQGPRPFGRKQQEWWKTYILLQFSIHFEYAWIPNTHIIGSFLVFRTWIVMKSTYYCNFLNILKIGGPKELSGPWGEAVLIELEYFRKKNFPALRAIFD